MKKREHERLVKETWKEYRKTQDKLEKLSKKYDELTWGSDRWCGICDEFASSV